MIGCLLNIEQEEQCCSMNNTTRPLHQSPSPNPTDPTDASIQTAGVGVRLKSNEPWRRQTRMTNHYKGRRTNSMILLSCCYLLLSATLSLQVEAKIHLIPQKAASKTNNNNSNTSGKNKNTKAKNKTKFHTRKDMLQHQHKLKKQQQAQNQKIILQPRPKQQTAAATSPKKKEIKEENTLALQATLSKNESGEHVLLLTPQSAQAVHSAVQAKDTATALTIPLVMQQAESTAVEEEEEQEMTEAESEEDVQVLFYDPDELKTKPGGEPPIPKKVFDENGDEVDLSGKEAHLVLPHEHHQHVGEEEEVEEDTSSNSSSSSKKSNLQQNTKKIKFRIQNSQTQDQMIIISTVATMALLVGALSARRLRSRQFLNFCIENENLEDELAYDAAYTTQSTVGASNLYGSGGGYDTFGGERYGGDLRWRGDLEKFDV